MMLLTNEKYFYVYNYYYFVCGYITNDKRLNIATKKGCYHNN